MPTTVETLLIAAGSGLSGGGLAGLLRLPGVKKNDYAESAKALASAYAVLVDDLRKDNVALREEIGMLRDRIARLETKLDLYQPTSRRSTDPPVIE